MSYICRPSSEHFRDIHARRQAGQFLDHFVGEARLGSGDEDSASDCLEKEDDGADGAEIADLDNRLADDDRDLEDETQPDADEGLVADPLSAGRVDVEGVDEACAEGSEERAEGHDRDVLTPYGKQAATSDGEDAGTEYKREIVDAGL